MSGIDEYIIGACFIETKPKPLPWNGRSKDRPEDTIESSSKTNDDVVNTEQVDTINHTDMSPDQGIITKDKAENILTKITFGDLKLKDITVNSKKRKEVKSEDTTISKIVDVELDNVPQSTRKYTYFTNKTEGNTVTRIVDVGLDEISGNKESFTYSPSKLGEYIDNMTTSLMSRNTDAMLLIANSDKRISGQYKESLRFGQSYSPSVTRGNTFGHIINAPLTSEKALTNESNVCPNADIDLRDEKVLVINELPKQTSLIQHEGNPPAKEGTIEYQETIDRNIDSIDMLAHKESSVVDASKGGKSLDVARSLVGYMGKIDHVNSLGMNDTLQYIGTDNEFREALSLCSNKELRRKIDKEFTSSGIRIELSKSISNETRKGCQLEISAKKTLAYRRPMMTGNVRATDLCGRKGKNGGKTLNADRKKYDFYVDTLHTTIDVGQCAFKDANAECNTEEEGTTIDNSFTDKNLENDLNRSTASVDETGSCHTKVGERKIPTTKKPVFTANVCATDHPRRKRKTGRKTVKTGGKLCASNVHKPLSIDTLQMTNEILHGEFKDAKAERNTKELDEEVGKRLTDNRLEIGQNKPTTPVNEKSCPSEISDGRLMLTENVRAEDQSGRECKNGTININTVDKQDSKSKSAHIIRTTNNVLNDDSSQETGMRKESTSRSQKMNTRPGDDNVIKSDTLSSIVVTKKKKRKKQREDKTRLKTKETAKASVEDDVFDITPIKDTPWSPSQEVRDNNQKKNRKPDRKTKSSNKKENNSRVNARDNIEVEERKSSQNAVGTRTSKRQLIFKGIGYESISCIITKPDKNVSVINVTPVETRYDRHDFDSVGRSNQSYKGLNDEVNSKGVLSIDKNDLSINNKDNQIEKKIRRRKKKIKKTVQKEIKGKILIDSTNSTDIILKKTTIGTFYSENEIRGNENVHIKDEVNTSQESCEFNTTLSPIIEENNEGTAINTTNNINNIAEISQDSELTSERQNEDTIDSVSILSLHCECRASVDETEVSVVNNNDDDIIVEDSRGSRWRRFLNWISCCFKPKVVD